MNSSFFSCNFTHALSAVLSNSIKAKAKKTQKEWSFLSSFQSDCRDKETKGGIPTFHSGGYGTWYECTSGPWTLCACMSNSPDHPNQWILILIIGRAWPNNYSDTLGPSDCIEINK